MYYLSVIIERILIIFFVIKSHFKSLGLIQIRVMKFYILNTINKVLSLSKKLDETALIENNHWVYIDDLNLEKRVYIFRPNGQLLISNNGVVEKSSWEYLDHGSLLIDTSEGSFLFRSGFLDDTILALNLDSSEEFAFFVNETKYGSDFKNLADLENYIESKYKKIEQVDEPQYRPQPEKATYVEVDNNCPACNYKGVNDSSECPSCGLNFI